MDHTELELRSDPAEAALLGAVAYHPDAMADVLTALPGDDFYKPARGTIWDICRELSTTRAPIDPVAVARTLTARNLYTPLIERLIQTEMTNAVSVDIARQYATVVADLARRREHIRTFQRAFQIVTTHEGAATDALTAARHILDKLDLDADDTVVGTLSWPELIDEFELAHAPGGTPPAIPTPWWELDDLIGGLAPSRLYVFGGSPGSGKSTAALNIAAYAAEASKQVLVFSKEMPTVDVTGRILARGAEVDLRSINHHRLSDLEMGRIRDYTKRVGTLPLRVNAAACTLGGIKTLTRATHHRHGLDILVVDYLQLVGTDKPGPSRQLEVAEISTELKRLAMDLGVAVVVPAQLNRQPSARHDAKPTMSDLRDSGKIEQDADAVILLWHQRTPDGAPTGEVTFIVDKNRHGPRGEITLRWHGGWGRIG